MALGSLFGIPSPYSSDDNRNLALAASIGLLSGQTGTQQAANAGQAVLPLMMQQQQQQKALAEQNKTLQYLEQTNPQLAAQVRAGMPIAEAWKAQMEARKPKQLQFKQLDDGTYGNYDESTGQFNKLGSAQKPAQPKFQVLPDGTYGWVNESNQSFTKAGTAAKPDLTSIQRDLIAAGLQPGTPEYQQAIMEHYRKSGMEITTNPDGTMTFSQGTTHRGPKLTVEEGKNAGFLLRAKSAEEVISKVGKEGTSVYNKTAQSLPLGIGNFAVSQDAQKYDQAQRDFVNAVLRQESGAVISPEEFNNAKIQYFPQPGDGPKVIEQKRINRENAIKGFQVRAGPAADIGGTTDGVIDSSEYFK